MKNESFSYCLSTKLLKMAAELAVADDSYAFVAAAVVAAAMVVVVSDDKRLAP